MIPESLRMFAALGNDLRASRTGLATNCSIGQTLADGAAQRGVGPGHIVYAKTGPVVVSEIEFGGVAVQVVGSAVLVNADHPAFEHRIIAFDGVGVDVVPPVFARAVGNEIVPGKVLGDIGVLPSFVGHDVGRGVDVRLDDREQVGLRGPADMEGHDAGALGAAFHQGHDGILMSVAASAFRLLVFGADEGFIDFHNAAGAAEGWQCPVSHGFPDPMVEEPSSLHATTQHTLYLVGADAFLAGAHQMDDLQPEVQPKMRGFEDGSHTHGEGLPAFIAFIQAGAGGFAGHLADARAIVVPAMRANRAARPQVRFDVGDCAFFGLELGGIENGLSYGKCSYGGESKSWGLVCQV